MTQKSVAELIAKMKEATKAIQAKEASSPANTPVLSSGDNNALFLGTFEDKEYVPHLKGMFNGKNTFILTDKIELLSHLEMYCAARKITAVVSTNVHILNKLLERRGNDKKVSKIADYAGSLFKHGNIEIVFISPLKQLFTVSYGKFLAARYISKVVAKDSWPDATSFHWELLNASNAESYYQTFSSAFAIACDIETFRRNLAIRCIGYTGIFISNDGKISTKSIVLPIDSVWALAWMRKFNTLPVQKIFQNGKYDNSYLLRYNAMPTHWFWDTANGMHSWYAELPKDLGFLNAFFLRDVIYWKDLAETKDLMEYYKYNATDTWATANVWIQQMLQMPDWAKRNYELKFRLNYPSLLAEMTGLMRDQKVLEATRKEIEAKEAPALATLRKCIGVPYFNPGSWQQVLKLLHLLGNKDLEKTGEIFLKKAMLRHPINNFLLSKILDIRGWRKLCSTYLRLESDGKADGEGGAKEYKSFWLYTLNPHGTDTGRNSSGEHHFWCGANIQNAPTRDGPEVKQTVRAPDGFYIAECDLEQAESRDTANIAGDESLIAAVSGERDFHSVNASAFFGVPYDQIYSQDTKKTINKKLRDLAKRVNHGANYNMGALVLIDTMGLDKIWEAKALLKLPYSDPKQIAQHHLDTFHKTYPKIKKAYYVSVINEVGTTHRLTSYAFHHTRYNLENYRATDYIREGDWTRYCFGKPDKNKLDLNSYVAHCPQSLNARTLDEAFMSVFYEIALPHAKNFRLNAQIHDSILHCYREGHEYLSEMVRKCMEIPVTLRDVSGEYRTFTVPAALKNGKAGKPAKYWSETE
jgi:DNA polymerase I-like protein with 3'-5' exonuclease and polymerase domains